MSRSCHNPNRCRYTRWDIANRGLLQHQGIMKFLRTPLGGHNIGTDGVFQSFSKSERVSQWSFIAK